MSQRSLRSIKLATNTVLRVRMRKCGRMHVYVNLCACACLRPSVDRCIAMGVCVGELVHVSVCICAYVRSWIYLYMLWRECTRVYIYIYIYMCVCICLRLCVCLRLCLYMCVSMCVYLFTCERALEWVCMRSRIHVCVLPVSFFFHLLGLSLIFSHCFILFSWLMIFCSVYVYVRARVCLKKREREKVCVYMCVPMSVYALYILYFYCRF